jgi:hypothetical protein
MSKYEPPVGGDDDKQYELDTTTRPVPLAPNAASKSLNGNKIGAIALGCGCATIAGVIALAVIVNFLAELNGR